MAWSHTEWNEKIARIRELLEKEQLSGVFITKGVNFTWLTGGRPYVNAAAENACAQIWVDRQKAVLVSNNIEAQRLTEEELTGLPLDEVISLAWHEAQAPTEIAEKLAEGKPWKTDDQLASFATLRWTLNEFEIDRYRALGKDAAMLMEKVAEGLAPGHTEQQIATTLKREGLALGIEAPVCLIAVDERCYLRRHPLPTDKPLEKMAMLVISGLRQGLYLSLTRMVHFGTPAEEVLARHKAVLQVEATMLAATKAGAIAEDVFSITQSAYEKAGFADQWQFHHQGGLAGYQSREYRIQPGNKVAFAANQAFAWNPTIAGVKSEDTVIIGQQGIEILSPCQKYPTLEVTAEGETFIRPNLWVR